MATRADAEKRVRLGFWIHLGVYAAVISGLAILNFNRNPEKLWVLWVAAGWGLGVILHGVNLCIPGKREQAIERTAARLDRHTVVK